MVGTFIFLNHLPSLSYKLNRERGALTSFFVAVPDAVDLFISQWVPEPLQRSFETLNQVAAAKAQRANQHAVFQFD